MSPPTFDEVYDAHFAFVWRCLRRLGVAPEALDDAAQDVFVVVHRRLGDWEGRGAITSWLFGIARRVAQDHRRHRARHPAGDPLPDDLIDAAASPFDALDRADAARVLHAFLESLDDDKRAVFILAELEQLPAPAIAEALEVNVNTVYSRLRAARAELERTISRRKP